MSVIEEIKARVDLIDVLQAYNVTLRKAGRFYKALCPFHNEKTPSFVVWPESGTWRCFGSCGDGGDVYKFVMKQENCDFGEALKLLAERAGIELAPRTPDQNNRDAFMDRLRALLKETAGFFHEQLVTSPNAAHARAYVDKRGLNAATQARFLIGYAPRGWQHVIEYLESLGYSESDILAAGVTTRNDQGRVYERFRNRLMIPIRDMRGAVIGFGARALDPDDNPKYLNSPQSPLFDKGRTLFAFDSARRLIRESETAVIVEGYMDALQAHQAGFSNVVAQMGTALTPPQIDQLSRYARRLVLALDPDPAGAIATLRELNLARRQLGSYKPEFDPHSGTIRQTSDLREFDLRVLTLPDGQDPDDLIRDTPDLWQELVANAQPLLEYVIAMRTAHITAQTPIADREQIARELLPDLLENELHRQHTVQQLALRLRINERDLMAFAQRQRREATNPVPASEDQQRALSKKVDSQRIDSQGQSDRRALGPGSALAPLSGSAPNRALTVRGGNAKPAAPSQSDSLTMEGYCLAALVNQPPLWSAINRRLAELKAEAKLATGNDLEQWLGPLAAEDFTRVDFRALLEALREAFDQDEMAPFEWLQETLPAELAVELDRLSAGPLARVIRPGTWQSRELESIMADRLRAGYEPSGDAPEAEFVERALYLRQRRLSREQNELYFAQADGYNTRDLSQRINRCTTALRLIDSAIRQAQRDRSRLTL
jgi:DNA primase